jgi:nitrogen-specific signal transduction histidine kinase
MSTNDAVPTGPSAPEETLSLMRRDIRMLTHDISSPLGVLRMAVYYLQTGNPDAEKRAHYYTLIAQSIDKVDGYLKSLRRLAVGEGESHSPPEPTSPDSP